jgi:hypothetical protein
MCETGMGHRVIQLNDDDDDDDDDDYDYVTLPDYDDMMIMTVFYVA